MELKAGYKQTEVGVIPKEWNCVALGALAASSRNAIVGGPFGSDLVSKDYVDHGVPVIRGQNMGAQWLNGPYVFVSPKKAESLAANLAKPKDLVFTQRGTLGQVSLIPDAPYEKYLISQSQMKCTLDSHIVLPRFIHLWFSSENGQRNIAENAIQTGVPHINLGILRSFYVPVPPIKEQHAIATALSDVDALLAKLDALITKKLDLKQASMQRLLTAQIRLPGFSGEWDVKRLGDIFTISAGTSKSTFVSDDGDYLICDMGSVSTKGSLCTSKRTNYGADFLNKGDLIMPKDDIGGGQIIGKVGFVNTDNLYVLSDHVYRLIALEDDAKFLAYVINSSPVNSSLRKKVVGSAQLGLGRKSVEEQEIKIPNYSEQIEIARVLSDMDAEITALEARRDKTRTLKQGMMQELLTGKTRLI